MTSVLTQLWNDRTDLIRGNNYEHATQATEGPHEVLLLGRHFNCPSRFSVQKWKTYRHDRVNMQVFYSDVDSRPTIRRGEYRAIFLWGRRKTVICKSGIISWFPPYIITSLSHRMFLTCFWNRLLLVGGWSQSSHQDQQSPKWPIQKISTTQLIILELAYFIIFRNHMVVGWHICI